MGQTSPYKLMAPVKGACRPGSAIRKHGAARGVRQNAGFTLGEVLVTVIIVGLVTSCLAVAVSFGTREYSKSLRLSESQQLYTSIEKVLSNELSYATYCNYNSSGVVTSFGMPSYTGDLPNGGTICYLDVTNNTKQVTGLLGGKDSSGQLVYGQVAFCDYATAVSDVSTTKRLVGSGSYTHDLVVCVKSLTYDATTQNFTVELAVKQSGSDNADINDGTFTVKWLNAK